MKQPYYLNIYNVSVDCLSRGWLRTVYPGGIRDGLKNQGSVGSLAERSAGIGGKPEDVAKAGPIIGRPLLVRLQVRLNNESLSRWI